MLRQLIKKERRMVPSWVEPWSDSSVFGRLPLKDERRQAWMVLLTSSTEIDVARAARPCGLALI